jgi:hypothetical protein
MKGEDLKTRLRLNREVEPQLYGTAEDQNLATTAMTYIGETSVDLGDPLFVAHRRLAGDIG